MIEELLHNWTVFVFGVAGIVIVAASWLGSELEHRRYMKEPDV